MSHRRLSAVAIGLVLPLLVVPAARAGTARLLALGGDGGYFADTANVFRWYGSLADHPDRFVIELGDVADGRDDALGAQGLVGHGGGVHVRLDEAGDWGTAAVYFQDHLPNGSSDGAFSAIWSRGCGRWQIGLGGRFSTYGVSSTGTEVGDRIDAQYFHQYGLGVRRELRDGWLIETAGEIVNSLTVVSRALDRIVADDWSTFGLRARMFAEIAPNLTLVPVLDHDRQQRGDYSSVLAGSADLSAHLTSLGIGANFRPGRETMLLISGEYRYGKQDLRLRAGDNQHAEWDASDRDFYQLRGRAGVESQILPWLTVRASVQYVRSHDDLYRFASAQTQDDVPRDEAWRLEAVGTPLSLGAGLEFGTLAVDLGFNDTSPLNPGLVAEGLFNGQSGGHSALTLNWRF